jgi:hypothetical protein
MSALLTLAATGSAAMADDPIAGTRSQRALVRSASRREMQAEVMGLFQEKKFELLQNGNHAIR